MAIEPTEQPFKITPGRGGELKQFTKKLTSNELIQLKEIISRRQGVVAVVSATSEVAARVEAENVAWWDRVCRRLGKSQGDGLRAESKTGMVTWTEFVPNKE
jgi:predicted ATPase